MEWGHRVVDTDMGSALRKGVRIDVGECNGRDYQASKVLDDR